MYAELGRRLAGGATVITPNRRLSAAIRRDFDQRTLQSGSRTWVAADVIPWRAWLERSFREAFLRGSVQRLLMSTPQARALWQRIIGAAPEGEGLLQIRSTAEAALEAWDLVHAWRLLPALQSMPLAEEPQAFLRWAGEYDAVCAREQLTDQARLADVVRDLSKKDAAPLPRALVLFGFDRLAPQQEALIETLRLRGVEVETHAPARGQSPASVLRHSDVAEELRAAALWARSRLSAEPAARIGVVVPELTRLRPAIARWLDEVLTPAAILHPGRAAPRPWNVSLGLPLSEWPLVHGALLLLELACRSLTIHRASLLLRSPFLGGAESERMARALLDVRLRRIGDPHVTLDQLLAQAGAEGHAYSCGILAERLKTLRYRVRDLPATPQPVSFWGPALQSILSAVHWPGERELNSEEYQTFAKWKDLMAALAQLDLVSPPLSFEAAVGALRGLAADEVFQPETPEVPIQVLGPLESAGLEFDHLLVLGLTDEAWPRLPRPNPLLPIELQRVRGLPAASAQGELAFARRLQQGWRQSAAQVVFSYYCAEGDRNLSRSPLLAGLPETTLAELGVKEEMSWPAELLASTQQERLRDWTGRSLPAGVVFGGGARLIQDQAACAFRGFAAHRLGAESLRHPSEGLDARDRGTLLHVALAVLWTELSTSQRLADTESAALVALIEHCVERALKRMRPQRTSAFQERFLTLERERLTALLLEWLEVERGRAPFEVIACEEERPVSVGGLGLKLRLDRVDRLAAGGELLIDYKTGKSPVAAWMTDRPDDPQLPLYSMARVDAPEAIAFARVRRGECEFIGVAEEGGTVAGIEEFSKNRYARDFTSWNALLAAWRATVTQLAVDFRSGRAPVAPKNRAVTCSYCDLHTLCRVAELADRDSPTAPGEGDDE